MTQRRNRASSSRDDGPLFHCFSSSQILLIVSHISVVSAVRTASAFSRAISKQLRIEGGFLAENTKKFVTVSSFASSRAVKHAFGQPALATAYPHPVVA